MLDSGFKEAAGGDGSLSDDDQSLSVISTGRRRFVLEKLDEEVEELSRRLEMSSPLIRR